MKNHIICLGASVAIAAGAYYIGMRSTGSACPGNRNISQEHCSLRTNMRKLWVDHVLWTRNYIIAAVAGTPDLKEATNRLLKNQADIGAAIIPHYGKEAGEKLAALLKEHILIAADLITAAKENDAAKLQAQDTRWHANADAIALFLSTANPHWPHAELKNMMYSHLKLTMQEVVARLKQDWAADIQAFEKVFDDIMHMSDAITTGISKQFPKAF